MPFYTIRENNILAKKSEFTGYNKVIWYNSTTLSKTENKLRTNIHINYTKLAHLQKNLTKYNYELEHNKITRNYKQKNIGIVAVQVRKLHRSSIKVK